MLQALWHQDIKSTQTSGHASLMPWCLGSSGTLRLALTNLKQAWAIDEHNRAIFGSLLRSRRKFR